MESFRFLELQGLDRFDGISQVLSRHQVRVGVVVDDRLVFVRSGHAINAEFTFLPRRERSQILPKARRLHEHFGAVLPQEFFISGGVYVFAQRIHDIRIDVILSRPRFIVSGGFLAANGAPRKERSLLTQLAGTQTCFVQHSVTQAEEISGYLRRGVNQKGEEVDLGIPKIVPLVGLSGKPFGGDAIVFCPCRGLENMEQVQADCLLYLDGR